MPRIPDAVKTKVTGQLTKQVSGLGGKLRQVDPARAKTSAVSGAGGAKDTFRLAVAYAKQETIQPVKGIGRYLAWGVGGAMFTGFGAVLLALSLLRALQTQTGSKLTGNLSWVPYLLTTLACIALIALTAMSMVRSIRTGTRRPQ